MISLERLKEIQKFCNLHPRDLADKEIPKPPNDEEDTIIKAYWKKLSNSYSYVDTVNRMIQREEGFIGYTCVHCGGGHLGIYCFHNDPI